eukprot:jgi/Pico_ML_1/55880/g1498.t1
MISLVGFADGSGRVLAVKDYRGEVSMERVREFCDNVFRTGDAADMPPLVQLGDVNFVFTKSKEGAPHTSHGKAKLKLSDGYIRWKIPEMTGGEEYRLTSSVDMVYKARKKHSAQVTAMKFITKKGKCEKDLEGLRQEIEILRNLKHENIVEMLDAFETPTEFCVVTEFAHGELFEVLQHDRRLKEDQRRGK